MAKGSIKWLGHAAFLISTPGGKKVFIDPWIEGNPLSAIKLSDIKSANLVLITHDHSDHVGSAADIVSRTGALLITQPETASRLQAELKVPADKILNGGYGMNIGGTARVDGITVIMTEALHSSATAAPAGYILKLEDNTTIYHAGDTGIFESMRLLGELYKMDYALLPIGSTFTMDPFQAAKALTLLKPRKAIPMHYRTLPFLEQSAEEFVSLARKEAPRVEVIALEPGQETTW